MNLPPDHVPAWPRGLNREQAARYIGVGVSKFDEMVRDGRMPKPVSIDARKVWDVRALDSKFDDLAADTTAEAAWEAFR